MPDLTPTETVILDIECHRWKYAGAKDAAVMDRLGWTRTRYEQVLLTMLDLARPDPPDHRRVGWGAGGSGRLAQHDPKTGKTSRLVSV